MYNDPSIKSPMVSIVCLTYNHAPYIKDCIEGFLMQKTTFPFEIIIHDDASVDGTKEIILEYANKNPNVIKPIIQEHNQYSIQGYFGKIIEDCFKNCSGKYIALCEGDDYWTNPSKLQKQFDVLESNDNINLSFHNAKVINLRDGIERDFVNNLRQGNVPYWKLILLPWCTPTASFFFRATCLSGKRQPKDINSDMFILYTCGVNGDIHYINEIMSVYRHGTIGSASDLIYRTSFIPIYEKKLALMRYINKITNNRYILFTSIKSLWLQLKKYKCRILGY